MPPQVQRALVEAAASHPELRNAAPPVALPLGLAAASRGAWAAAARAVRPEALHREVHETLVTMGYAPHLGVSTSDGQCLVDVALHLKGKRVALALEGTAAFAANAPHVPLGATVSRWRALQARGWQVRRLCCAGGLWEGT
jgi:hypothetical protein